MRCSAVRCRAAQRSCAAPHKRRLPPSSSQRCASAPLFFELLPFSHLQCSLLFLLLRLGRAYRAKPRCGGGPKGLCRLLALLAPQSLSRPLPIYLSLPLLHSHTRFFPPLLRVRQPASPSRARGHSQCAARGGCSRVAARARAASLGQLGCTSQSGTSTFFLSSSSSFSSCLLCFSCFRASVRVSVFPRQTQKDRCLSLGVPAGPVADKQPGSKPSQNLLENRTQASKSKQKQTKTLEVCGPSLRGPSLSHSLALCRLREEAPGAAAAARRDLVCSARAEARRGPQQGCAKRRGAHRDAAARPRAVLVVWWFSTVPRP